MKQTVIILAAACLGLNLGCQKSPPAADAPKTPAATTPATTALGPKPLLHLHFVGLDALIANPDAAKIKAITALPASQTLREQVIRKLSQALPRAIWHQTNVTALAEKMSPLAGDLFHAELYVEARGHTNQPQWTVALRLDPLRVRLWQSNLTAFFADGNHAAPKSISVDGLSGWEAGLGATTDKVQFLTAGDWVVISWGPGLAESNPLLPLVKNKTPASGDWLTLDTDLAYWGPRLDLPMAAPWPALNLTLVGKADDLRTRAQLRYAAPRQWQLGPWLVPTNTIQDPVNSFTAIQSLAPWLKEWDFFKQANDAHAPNQLFLWAQNDLAYQTFAAFPADHATNQVMAMGEEIKKLAAPLLARPGHGAITNNTTGSVVWRDLVPILIPFLRAAPEPADNFILAGVFPVDQETRPLPGELLAQFSTRTNLLYYDWEITETRLAQWRQLSQLALMLSAQPPGADTPGQNWLQALAPLLGNTITEVTVTSPQELTALRKSHLGLTAFELTLVAQWLDNPAFPRFASPFEEQPSGPPAPGTLPKGR